MKRSRPRIRRRLRVRDGMIVVILTALVFGWIAFGRSVALRPGEPMDRDLGVYATLVILVASSVVLLWLLILWSPPPIDRR